MKYCMLTALPEEAASAISAEVPFRPPAIICAANSSVPAMASEFISTGRKKIARTRPRHFILRFSSIATNSEKKTISGTSMIMLLREVTRVCLKVPWPVKAVM